MENADTETMMQRARAVLDERARLDAFGRDLKTRQEAAAQAVVDATAALAHADAQAVIAPAAERTNWVREADAQATKLTEAQREHARLAATAAYLPGMFLAADDRLMETNGELSAGITALHASARADLAAKARAVAVQWAEVLRDAHALVAGGVLMGPFLSATMLPNPAGGSPFVPSGYSLVLDEEVINLNEDWRNNSGPKSLFEAHIPLAVLRNSFERHVSRIREDRQRAVAAVNAANYARSFSHAHSPVDYSNGVKTEHVPPKSTFEPSNSTHRPPAAIQDATVRPDIGLDEPAPMSRGAIEALWDNPTGARVPAAVGPSQADPYDTPEFRELALKMPKRMARQQIDNEAHLKRQRLTHDGTGGLAAPANDAGGGPEVETPEGA